MALSGGTNFSLTQGVTSTATGSSYTSREGIFWQHTGYYKPAAAPAPTAAPPPPVPVAPVTPIAFDPQLEANALYGKRMVLSALGKARIGSAPAPIVGPYINTPYVDFIVSFGVPADPEGTRVLFAIYLDQELAWECPAGGTAPGDGTFLAESFDFTFKQGRLDQTVCSLESEKFPGEENAYRPQMLLQIRDLPYQRFLDRTGKPVPYVSADIGDTTDSAIPEDGINVGEGFVRIATSPWGGFTAANCESVDVTDIAPGYLIGQDIGTIDLGRSMTYFPNIRLLQSDKLRMSDYGSDVEPTFVFTRDMIVGGDQPITINRADPSSLPRQEELLTVDPDQDYTVVPSLAQRARDPVAVSSAVGKKVTTLPIVMDSDSRQSLATFRMYFDDNARKTVAFNAMPAAIECEPGDLIAFNEIADGIDNEVFEIIETTHYPNFQVGIVARAILRCSFYTAPAEPVVTFRTAEQVLALQTFTEIPIVTPCLVVVMVIGTRQAGEARTISDVRINGVSATIHHQFGVDGGPSPVFGVASLVVASGTTADIEVDFSGGLTSKFISVYTITDYSSDTPYDFGTSSVPTGDPSVAIDVPQNGAVFAVWAGLFENPPFAVTFTGVDTEVYDNDLFDGMAGRLGAAHQLDLNAETGRAVSATSAQDDEAMLVVSWV